MGILDRLLGRKQKLPEVKSDQSEEDQSEEDTLYALGLIDGLRRLLMLPRSESDLLKTTSVLEGLVGKLTHGKGADFLDQSDETVQTLLVTGAAVKGMVPEDAIYAYDLVNVLRALLVAGMSEYDGLMTTMVLEPLIEFVMGEKIFDGREGGTDA